MLRLFTEFGISPSGGAGGSISPSALSGLSLWLDGDDSATITASGGALSQWSDKSGQGNHATQSTGANKPVTGTRTLNGKNVIDFDGTAHYLNLPSSIYGLSNGDNTIFIVSLIDSTAATQCAISLSGGAGRTRLLPCDTATVNMSGGSHASGTVASLPYTLSTSVAKISMLVRDGSIALVGTDGVESSTAAASSFTATAARIGSFTSGVQFLDGVLAEVIAYNRALSNEEINLVANYLKNKWNVVWDNILSIPALLDNKTTMVGFGDSITAGQAASTTRQQWIQIVGSALRTTVTNQGVSGTVLQNSNDNGGAPRASNGRDRYVADLTGAAKRDICIISYGLNDLRYQALPSDFSRANFKNDYQEILTGLLGAGYAATDILLCTPYYMTTNGYLTGSSGFTGANATINLDYGAAVRELAVTNGTLFADVYAYMAANGGDSLISADNIHPNDNGHVAIAKAVMQATLVS